MATEIIMPKAGMAMERGTIIQWLKEPGDPVAVGEPILEIETDKVSMEVEAEVSGYLLSILYEEGAEVDVITTIGYIGSQEESPPVVKAATDEGADTANQELSTDTHGLRATPAARRYAKETGASLSSINAGGKWGEIRRSDVEKAVASRDHSRISPLAKTIAERHGVDPGTVSGSGPGGRILKDDVLAATKQGEHHSRRPVPSMRRIIAERMMESHQSIPPVTLNKKIDVTSLFAFRNTINTDLSETQERISLTSFFVRAVALTLVETPWMRTFLDKDTLVERSDISIGIAVALEEGLLVPVLRNVDTLSLMEIHRQSADLITRARQRTVRAEELQGALFSITNLGMYGISSFTPIINPPETAILGINAAEDQLSLKNGEVVTRTVMTLSLTIDHRVIDGAQGALFLQKLEDYLLTPGRLVL